MVGVLWVVQSRHRTLEFRGGQQTCANSAVSVYAFLYIICDVHTGMRWVMVCVCACIRMRV